MSLIRYHQKRNFKRTPEPLGKKSKKRTQKLLYLIQKHAASHLHYDLRLELAGTLKSWAVPKGPSLDPSVKRLAVHVEDHPIEYGSFEGIIPQGEYGGGTVMLWDTGEWQCVNENPDQAFQKGNLTFILKGKKLKGLWKLIQIKSDPKNWLLMKLDDKYAQEDQAEITITKPNSVKSRRSIDSIAKQVAKTSATSERSKRKLIKKLTPASDIAMPSAIYPQLATLVAEPPAGDKWLHEIKFDGYRLIAYIKKNKIKLITRNQNDWTSKFPVIKNELAKLNLSTAILDGELVAINNKKQFDFQLLQNSIHNKDTSALIYYVFDIIYYDQHDLSHLPLLERKKILNNILPKKKSTLRYSDHVVGEGKKVFINACKLGLEGIMSKAADSPYVQKRTHHWLKAKCKKRQEFIIGGYTKPRGERKYFGSLLIGTHLPNKKLKYCGHVGTGFSDETLKMMANLLAKYETNQMPFAELPPDVKNVTWLKPELVAEVEFSDWTQDKILRQPSFKGLRSDKSSKEITVEAAQSVKKIIDSEKIPVRKVIRRAKAEPTYPITNPDRILFSNPPITKFELAEFYDTISEWILPYIINRPLTLLRCPSGHHQDSFYQKHLSAGSPKSLYPINVAEHGKPENYLYIKNKDGLLGLVQLGVLEIHPWGARIDHLEKPDMIIFDLDPAPDVEWKKVIAAAKLMRNELNKLKLTSFVKTTGGKGLHIVVPIKTHYGWDEIKTYAHTFVQYIVSLKPDSYISVMTKAKRPGKIFLDYLRNQREATAIAPYSTRAREGAPVATPLSWDELSGKIRSDTFTIQNLPQRLAKLKKDPWQGFFEIKQQIKLKG